MSFSGDIDDSVLEAYLTEAKEHLANAENSLLLIEEQGAEFDQELINEVFRAVHTIKGGSSFYGLTNINILSHEAENILSLVRNNKLNPTPDVMDKILQSIDKLGELINSHAGSNDIDVSYLIEDLRSISSPSGNIASDKEKTGEGNKTGEFTLKYDKNKLITGQSLYLIHLDTVIDCNEKKRSIKDIIEKTIFMGEILSSNYPVETIDESYRGNLYMLYQSPLDISVLANIIDLPAERFSNWVEGTLITIPDEKQLIKDISHNKEKNDLAEEIELLLEGNLNVDRAEEIKKDIQSAFKKAKSIEVKFGQLSSIDFAFLQLLCSAHKTAYNSNKCIVLSGELPDLFKDFAKSAGYYFKDGCQWDIDRRCLWLEENFY